jgi:effector-binding domain-containing protein
MTYACELIERAEQPTYTVRTLTPVSELPQLMGDVYARLGGALGALGEEPTGPPFAAYHNMDMQDLDVEIGFTVARALTAQDDMQPGVLPGGTFAACLFTGPYAEIGPAYEVLSAWVEGRGHQTSGAAYELYLNDPSQTPPDQLQTQILFRLTDA